MDALPHILALILAVLIILLAIMFLVIDMFARVDYLKERAPGLEKWLARRGAIGALTLVGVFLLVADGYELINKEVPDIPAPVVKIYAPHAPELEQTDDGTAPDLQGSLDSLGWGTVNQNGDQVTFVTVAITVKNPHDAPTGLDHWNMSVQFPGGRFVEAKPATPPLDRPLTQLNGQILLFPAADYLPNKSLEPIPSGGAIAGWLAGTLPKEIKVADLYAGAKCIVSASDITTGRQHDFQERPTGELN